MLPQDLLQQLAVLGAEVIPQKGYLGLEGLGGARPPSSRSIAISLTLNVTSGPSGTTGWEDVAEAVSRELVRRLRYLV